MDGIDIGPTEPNIKRHKQNELNHLLIEPRNIAVGLTSSFGTAQE